MLVSVAWHRWLLTDDKRSKNFSCQMSVISRSRVEPRLGRNTENHNAHFSRIEFQIKWFFYHLKWNYHEKYIPVRMRHWQLCYVSLVNININSCLCYLYRNALLTQTPSALNFRLIPVCSIYQKIITDCEFSI